MRAMVTLPTFNERENIERLIGTIRKANPDVGVVVADDDSPDGTWRIVERIAREDPGVFLLRRTEKKGRGSAGVDAFRFALKKDAEVIIEMDADFSHDPKYIPVLLDQIRKFDLVLGSRAVGKGRDMRQSPVRRAVTLVSSLYARGVLGIPARDVNSGYRCFRREVLEAVDLSSIRSTGPSIVQELLYKAYLRGFTVSEVPITFPDRKAGKSSLSVKKLLQGFVMVLRLKGLQVMGKI